MQVTYTIQAVWFVFSHFGEGGRYVLGALHSLYVSMEFKH